MTLTCQECGRAFTAAGSRGPTKRFCSQRCQKRDYRRRKQDTQFPEAMSTATRWARADGKRPIMPDGSPASSTDPSTWSPLRAVLAGEGDGFGFMLGDGVGCYDLDYAMHNGVLKAWARQVIASIPEPIIYTEASVSGQGVHVFVEAPEGAGSRRRVGDGGVERYTRARFIRVGVPLTL